MSWNSRITQWSLYWWLQIKERVGASAGINNHFQSGETICCHLSKSLSDNRTITLAQNYYWYTGPVHYDAWCSSLLWLNVLLTGKGVGTENPFICPVLTPYGYWVTRRWYRFCWVASHCEREGNEGVDHLGKETIDLGIDWLTCVHYADVKFLVNSYIQQLVQINRMLLYIWKT